MPTIQYELSYLTGNSTLLDNMTAETSLLNENAGQDNLAFGQNFEGVFPTDMPLGANQLKGYGSTTAIRVYKVRNAGVINFGDGNDGNVTISANTTLTSDRYYENLVINSGVTLTPGQYRIFVADTAHIYGTVSQPGNNGSNGADDVGGAGGAAIAAGYFTAGAAGVAGANGVTQGNAGAVGASGPSVTNSLGSAGAAAGRGGNCPVLLGGVGGSAGTATASNVELIANWHLATGLDVAASGSTVKFTASAGSGSGGSGASDASSGAISGGGGGSPSPGGIIAIYAKRIILYINAVIHADGANGGNGASKNVINNAAAGGGAAASDGGVIILVYNELQNNGTLRAAAGTVGSGGITSGGSACGNGVAGNAAGAGTVFQFEVSL